MKKDKSDLLREIKETREQLHDYIDKNGIDKDPLLMEINIKLDELILKWLKNNQ